MQSFISLFDFQKLKYSLRIKQRAMITWATSLMKTFVFKKASCAETEREREFKNLGKFFSSTLYQFNNFKISNYFE